MAVELRQVGADEAGLRLDRWFRRHYPQLGHGGLQKLLRGGQVRLDGKRAKASDRLEAGQTVRVPPLPDASPAPKERSQVSAADAAMLRQRVLHRDESVILLDKPAGLAVQGGSGQSRHLDGLLDALTGPDGERPRLVHRLDRDTAGCLALGIGAGPAAALTAAFREDRVEKIYWALAERRPPATRGVIDLALVKAGQPGSARMVGDPEEGRTAVTLYAEVARIGHGPLAGAAWLALMPLTGRTHQLRAHLAALGCPILGDGKYGQGRGLKLQLLARSLALPHPDDGTTLRCEAPLPSHMLESWQAAGWCDAEGALSAKAESQRIAAEDYLRRERPASLGRMER